MVAHDLPKLAARAQPRDVHRRLGPGGDHEVRHHRQVLEQEAQALVDLRLRDEVVVVEHEDVLLLGAHQRVDEHRERSVADRRAGSRDRRLEGRGHVHARLSQSRRDVGPEARGIVVVLVQREPGEGHLVLDREPLGQQGRLSPAGRRGHQVQAAVEPVPEPFDQVASGHVAGA